MRKKIAAGNWKMNINMQEGINLAKDFISLVENEKKLEKKDYLHIILSPPFTLLNSCVGMVKKTRKISIAAQNCHSEENGAFTGEISASMIQSTGATYVIIGHSERRFYFKESNEYLGKKIIIALKHDLIPIFCCGENLSQRNSGAHFETVKKQLRESLFHLDRSEFEKIIIAYEPVWAIGTGVNATPQQAQEMHEFIRAKVAPIYGSEIAGNLSILYGGSLNSENAPELFANPDVDGGLIGGASLKPQEFYQIVLSLFDSMKPT